MLDPATAIAAAAALARKASAEDDTSDAGKLHIFSRVLVPSADEVGEALRRWTAYRVRNVERIVDVAAKKSRHSAGGSVPPRLAHKLIEEGSYCDDELMAEYLGGVLAGARTPSGRDDRSITWTTLITQMSVFEIKAHYLLYTEMVAAATDLATAQSLIDARWTTVVDGNELMNRLVESGEEPAAASIFEHAVTGLQRRGLVGDLTTWGATDDEVDAEVRFLRPALSESLPYEIT